MRDPVPRCQGWGLWQGLLAAGVPLRSLCSTCSCAPRVFRRASQGPQGRVVPFGGARQGPVRRLRTAVQQRRPGRVPRFIGAFSSSPHTVLLCLGVIRLLGFTTLHDSRRYAVRNSAMLGPSHPDTKARCTGDDEYAPINLGTRPGRRCWTAVRDRRSGPCRAPPEGTTRPCGP